MTTEQQKEWDAVLEERRTGIKAEPETLPEKEVVKDEKSAKADTESKAATAANDKTQGKTQDQLPSDQFAQILARIDKFDSRVRNVEGHIGNLTSQQKKTNEAIQAAAAQAATKVSDAPSATAVKEAVKTPEAWAKIKADFPEWSEAMEGFLDSKISGLHNLDPDAVQKIVDEQVKGQTATVRNEIIQAALDAVFPGWVEEVKSEDFTNWLAVQSDEVRALSESLKIADAARMLRLYDKHKDSSITTEITQNRQSKLDAAATAPTKTAGKKPLQKSVDDMTPEELWDYEVKQRQRRKNSL